MSFFLDSNVLIYANDRRDSRKQQIAKELIARGLREKSAVVSTQVLAEFANVTLGKLREPAQAVMEQLLMFESLQVVQLTPVLIRRGIELRELYKVQFWDAQIIATAEQPKCDVLFSEDLNPGQLYAGVRVENPFA